MSGKIQHPYNTQMSCLKIMANHVLEILLYSLLGGDRILADISAFFISERYREQRLV